MQIQRVTTLIRELWLLRIGISQLHQAYMPLLLLPPTLVNGLLWAAQCHSWNDNYVLELGAARIYKRATKRSFSYDCQVWSLVSEMESVIMPRCSGAVHRTAYLTSHRLSAGKQASLSGSVNEFSRLPVQLSDCPLHLVWVDSPQSSTPQVKHN